MMNMIRADLYYLTRGKGIYITSAIIVALNILMIFILAPTLTPDSSAIINGVQIPYMGRTIDGITSIPLLYMTTSQTNILLMVFVLLAVSPMFHNGTVKNDLAWGVSRTKLYASKLAVSLILCSMMVGLYVMSGFLLATIANGFGGPVPEGLFLTAFQSLGAQLWMFFALTAILVFLIFVTKREGVVIVAFIFGGIVPQMLLFLMNEIGVRIPTWLFYFDIGSGINRLGVLELLETRSIILILTAGAVYFLATTIGGIVWFRRGSVK